MTEDFIGVYPNLFSKDFCQKAIEHFEQMDSNGFVRSRQEDENNIPKSKKDDSSLLLDQYYKFDTSRELSQELSDQFWTIAYADYVSKFDILTTFEGHRNYHIKIQKTKIGGGYHVWHCEDSTRDNSNRILAWMVYLNDVEDGGETEFLYQHKRIKPIAGTCLIWPAGFTHTHRGNPPLTNDKYVITGWVEF